MKITIIGSGYVGLVTGACLAEVGNTVVCLDVDRNKIAMLMDGRVPIYEPGLSDIVKRNIVARRLVFTTDVEKAVEHGALQIIAVGTPSGEDGSADLSYVLSAARNIGRYMRETKIVVNKSTVPVGTANKVRAVIEAELEERSKELHFDVVSNPEFLKEGAAIEDFMRPDRIVIGASKPESFKLMREIYAPFNRNHDRILEMDVHSAELTKYAANAMLATRISFMNELAMLAERVGADIELVRQGIGSDDRIGFHFLYAGCGYGGSCFPKDVRALISSSVEHGNLPMRVLHAVDAANNEQKSILSKKVFARYGQALDGFRFAIWGLAFKPNTDDLREAPSLTLISDLLGAGAALTVYDPVAMPEARKNLGDSAKLNFADGPVTACIDADALIIVTEWKEFRSPDFDAIRSALRDPVIFDGRNIFDPNMMRGIGFEYMGIGRGLPGPVLN